MPGSTGRGRRTPIGHIVQFQLLPYRVEVAVEDDRLVPVLAYLANDADQPIAPIAAMRYDVVGLGPYVVLEEGDHLAAVERPDDVLYVVYGRCHARLLDHMGLGGWVALHAGIVSVDGRRVLMVGAKGAGKTTLLLRLLHEGHAVEGDEVVFTRAGEAVCQPRNFHVKPSSERLLPELAEAWASLPRTSTSDGLVIRGFNPATAGFAWTVTRGPVDAMFVLCPDHDRTAACWPTSSVAGVEAAITNALPTALDTGYVVRACALLLGNVPAHVLVVGDVGATATLLADTVRRGTSTRRATESL